jgi:hypothetical protein
MPKLKLLTGVALLLAACASKPGFPTEAACRATAPQYGEFQYCGYYPGYGWAHVPFPTSIRQN